jgi:PilZ domain
MHQGEGQHRRVPRYPFSALATVVPPAGTPVGGTVTELSLYGCYLGSGAPLAARTRVVIKIFAADGEYFEADATVIYSHPSLGMGLAFRQVRPEFLTLLRKWLIKATQQDQAESKNPEEPEQEDEGPKETF